MYKIVYNYYQTLLVGIIYFHNHWFSLPGRRKHRAAGGGTWGTQEGCDPAWEMRDRI